MSCDAHPTDQNFNPPRGISISDESHQTDPTQDELIKLRLQIEQMQQDEEIKTQNMLLELWTMKEEHRSLRESTESKLRAMTAEIRTLRSARSSDSIIQTIQTMETDRQYNLKQTLSGVLLGGLGYWYYLSGPSLSDRVRHLETKVSTMPLNTLLCLSEGLWAEIAIHPQDDDTLSITADTLGEIRKKCRIITIEMSTPTVNDANDEEREL